MTVAPIIPPENDQTRIRRRRRWLDVHFYLALVVGFMFVILGLTGSMNAFFWEFDAWLNPQIAFVEPIGQPQPLDDIMAALKRAHPRRTGAWSLTLPDDERGILRAGYAKPEEKAGEFLAPLMVAVNPYTGDILANRFWGETLMTFIYEIHADLWLGANGFQVVGVLGLLLLLSLGTGIYLWWPSPGKWKAALTLKRKTSSARLVFDLHKLGGIYFLPLLAGLALTGCWFVYHDAIKSLIREFVPLREAPKDLVSIPLPETSALTIAESVAIARKIFPQGSLKQVLTPNGPTGTYEIALRQPGEANISQPASRVWLDQFSGKPLYIQDPNQFTLTETLINLMWPLHNGEALGLPGRILVCASGFVPLLLYITGITRWLQKRKARRAKFSYRTAAAEPFAGSALLNPLLAIRNRSDK